MKIKIKNPTDKIEAAKMIESLDLTNGKTYNITISTKRKIRSLSQNALYWLWLSCIEEETGNDKETLHEFFKQEYLGRLAIQVFNYEVYPCRSTSSLNTKEFTNYLEKIKVFASAELSIILPLPQDLHFHEFYERYKDFI